MHIQHLGNHLCAELAEFMNGVLLMKQSTPFPQHCWWHFSGRYLPKIYFVSYLKSLLHKTRSELIPIWYQAWSNYIILQKPVIEMTPWIFMAEKTTLQTKTPRKQNQLQHQKGEMSNPLSHAWESKTAPGCISSISCTTRALQGAEQGNSSVSSLLLPNAGGSGRAKGSINEYVEYKKARQVTNKNICKWMFESQGSTGAAE